MSKSIIITKNRIMKQPALVSDCSRIIFLSNDFDSLLKLRRICKPDNRIETLGKLFFDTVNLIRPDFLQLSHQINVQNNTESFWGSQLASRNSATIPLLRYLTYFVCAREILKNNSVAFVVDSYSIGKSLAEFLKPDHLKFEHTILERWEKHALLATRVLKSSMFWYQAACAKLYFIRTAIPTKAFFESKNIFLIRSWVTEGNANEHGHYSDRSFGSLYEELKLNGYTPWILPEFFNLNRSFISQINLLLSTKHNFIFVDRYLTFWDYFKCYLAEWQKPKLEDLIFQGREVKQIVLYSHLQVFLAWEHMRHNLVTPFISRITKENIDLKGVTYPMECNAIEKPFILAIKRNFPHVPVTGYQHSTLLQQQLGEEIVKEEAHYHPLPDRIICSGKKYLEIFETLGFPKERLFLGPNFRFDINLKWRRNFKNTTDAPLVSILLNFSLTQSKELLIKTALALKGMENLRVLVKSHPLLNVEDIKIFLRSINLLQCEVTALSVPEIVDQSTIVVMTAGSPSNLEVAVQSVPLVRVLIENDFNFDPFWDEHKLFGYSVTPNEIREKICYFLKRPNEYSEDLSRYSQYVSENYFERVRPENLRIFWEDIDASYR